MKVRFNGCHKYKLYNLTVGKVYDVIEYTRHQDRQDDMILIKRDDGIECNYFMIDESIYELFTDITGEIRDETIVEILE